MSRMMIQAAVTMNQLQNRLDMIGHNISNSQTTGYKTRDAEFSSLIKQHIDNTNNPVNDEGRLTPLGIRVGSGARLGPTQIDLSQGPLKQTERSLDAALTKDNLLFQVAVEQNGVEETLYTRDGAFYLSPVNDDQDLVLTDQAGNLIIGADGPIVIPTGFQNIDISNSGEITVQRDGQPEYAGQLAIVEAVRPELLEGVGTNHFRMPDVLPLDYNFDELIQGVDAGEAVLQNATLEQANVDQGKQMTDMILAQRSYQFNARTISMADEMMGLINQVR